MFFDDGYIEDDVNIKRLKASDIFHRIAPMFSGEKRSLIIGLILILLASAGNMIGPLILRYIIDNGIAKSDIQTIIYSVILYTAVLLVGNLSAYLQVGVITKAGLNVITKLKEKLFSHILGLSLAYFDKHSPGVLMSRVESDTERLQMVFSDLSLMMIRSVLIVISTIVIMAITSIKVTLALLIILIPFGVMTFFILKLVREMVRRTRGLLSKVTKYLTEHIQALSIIQIYGFRQSSFIKLIELDRKKFRAESMANIPEMGMWGLVMTVEAISVMVVLYMVSEKMFGLNMSLGTVVLFIQYTQYLFFPIIMFSEQLSFIQRAFASADRVFAILDTPSRTPDKIGALDKLPHDWKEITFEDVSFDYDGGTKALDSVSFKIKKGEKVALVGISGGGKSTITSLLLRFYEPTKGRIAIDGIDIRDISLNTWRKNIGLVMQDIHLFPGTLGENLKVFSNDISDNEIYHALDIVQARDVIKNYSEGLNVDLEEGGTNLSQGERQLMCFARAVTPSPEFLILDEATSSVDPATETKLQTALNNIFEGRTSLIVAHRLSTIITADKILVIHRGKLIEEGDHKSLLKKKGVYSDLFELQFGGGEKFIL